MMAESTQAATAANKLIIERLLPFDRQLVFDAFTQGSHLAHWWGPKGMRLDVVQADVRPGGIFHYGMTAPQGTMYGRFLYEEIVAPQLLTYYSSFADAEGNVAPAPFPGHFPLLIHNRVEFMEAGGKTLLRLTGTPHEASAEQIDFFNKMHASMQGGFAGTLDELEAYLGSLAK